MFRSVAPHKTIPWLVVNYNDKICYSHFCTLNIIHGLNREICTIENCAEMRENLI